VHTIQELVARRDRDGVREWTQARLAKREREEQISCLAAADMMALTRLLDRDTLIELIGALRPTAAAGLLDQLAVAEVADVFETLPPDKAADIAQSARLGRLPAVLAAMEPSEAAELEALVRWPADTAGGRMTPAFVAMAPGVQADQAVAELRRVAADAETISYVYVVAAGKKLLGVLSLRNLVLTAPDALVGQLVETDIITVPPTMDQEEAAHLLIDNDLAAIPVVQDGTILGIITADDVADIIEQETTEDFARLGGSQPLELPYLRASPALLWRKRILWLLALFVAEAYTGTVLRHFESDLEAVVALAFFVPLLIGTGGNVGSQIVTTLVRAMAVEGVRLADVVKVVGKESATGVLLAAVLAAAAFARAVILNVGYDVSFVVAATIAAIVLWASLVGAVLPLVLRRLRADPAVVSAPLITTLVDGTGLLIYFWIARLIL
jgi:magnesium transporter